MKDQKVLIQKLKDYWFNEIEVEKILRWLKDEEEWRTCTMSEVYNELNLKIKTFPNEHNFYSITKGRLKTNKKIHFQWQQNICR